VLPDVVEGEEQASSVHGGTRSNGHFLGAIAPALLKGWSPCASAIGSQDIFGTLGPLVEVKVIKDKQTGMSAGYGFVKFVDHRWDGVGGGQRLSTR
jgi:RNA recognition motif. (a.k.a. RRM, RBD, or RNP domain)